MRAKLIQDISWDWLFLSIAANIVYHISAHFTSPLTAIGGAVFTLLLIAIIDWGRRK